MLYRLTILLVFGVCTNCVSGQQLPLGRYVLSTGFTYTSFNFKKNARFDYHLSSCTGGEEGSGSYTLKNGELLLLFDNPMDKPLPALPELHRTGTSNDTTYLEFSLIGSSDGLGVPAVILSYVDRKTWGRFGTYSDSLGMARITVQNDRLPIDLSINAIGAHPDTIRIGHSGVYTIRHTFNFEFMRYLVKGDTRKFIVEDFDWDELILRPVNEPTFAFRNVGIFDAAFKDLRDERSTANPGESGKQSFYGMHPFAA